MCFKRGNGAAARSEIAKFLIPGATARPHPLNGAPARPAHPRATKVHGAFAPSSWRALALGALGMVPGRAARPRPLMVRPREPTKTCFGPPKGPCARALSMARPRDGVRS
ncbi:hypothetical protein PIB30_055199 [Stylosanthes scabra]|uniref:Uncharacterized protein n=1 Tax=Stylosanthes scabra TaxID=79078 RepID=A0ABU6QJE1_9FABA|nr:hypothetical protein [Stylosanthes scabra]